MSRDLTIKYLGVPYCMFFDRVSVYDPNGSTQPTLTIEPGVELRFDDYMMVGFTNSAQLVDRIATLHAVGTAALPIISRPRSRLRPRSQGGSCVEPAPAVESTQISREASDGSENWLARGTRAGMRWLFDQYRCGQQQRRNHGGLEYQRRK